MTKSRVWSLKSNSYSFTYSFLLQKTEILRPFVGWIRMTYVQKAMNNSTGGNYSWNMKLDFFFLTAVFFYLDQLPTQGVSLGDLKN
jgi:hypothetical protein